MNLIYLSKTKKIICLLTFFNILFFLPGISFAAQGSYKQRSLYDTVMEQGVFSINVQSVSPPSSLPSASAIPIDNLIKQISERDSFVTYSDSDTALRQWRLNFLKKNRITFLKWSKEAVKKLDDYVITHKGSLEALNNLQILAEIIKCHQNGGTPEQCARQAGKDALMRLAGGTVISYLGLGSLGTFGALAMADFEAAINTVECYNEVTGLIEDQKTAEKQRIDRMALGADVGSMKSYLELMQVRYEQNQNSVGELLIEFWEDAEDQSKRLKTAEDEFIHAWKNIEAKKYPEQLQGNCEKNCNLDEKCSALINSYTVLTGNSPPETGANMSSLSTEFQAALNSSFEKKCIAFSGDIKKKIETIIQKKVDPLHNGYKSLDFSITHAEHAREKYLADQKKYLQRNQILNQHYEQQLAERYGKNSDRYKEGMAVLDGISNQMKTYQPQGLKGNIKYIFKRLKRIEEDFEFTKKRLTDFFSRIETHIVAINKVEKNFKSTAQSKSNALATQFKACAYDRITNPSASPADGTIKDNGQVKKRCNGTKTAAIVLSGKIQDNEKKFILFGDKLKKFFKKFKSLKKESQFIKTAHKDLEKKAATIAEISHELEKLSLKICETTKALNDYTKTDSEHDKNYDWINNKKEKLKEQLDFAKDIIKEADSLDKESRKRLETARLLKETSQAALQKIDKDIEALLDTNFGERMDDLNKKAAMISTDSCSEDVFAALKEATKQYQKYQDKLEQITAFYKAIKIDFNKKVAALEDLEQIYQKTAYLLDLSKAYVERAENAAVKGVFCAVLAENIMEKVFIPDVRGSEINSARSKVSQKGLIVTISELGPPPSQGKAGIVTQITPGITKRVKKGTSVTLSYYDARPDRASQLANYDCRQWPGSQPVWDTQNDRPACGCMGDMVWNQDNTKCISRIDAALANADCSHKPGSTPRWNYMTHQVDCECELPYSQDPMTGKCVDFMAQADQGNREFIQKLEKDQQAFDKAMADQRNLNQEQNQQFYNNFMGMVYGHSQPIGPGNSIPQNNHPAPSVVKHSECNNVKKAGGHKAERHVINLGRSMGRFQFEYKTYTAKDELRVSTPDGGVLFQTGCIGTGNRWKAVMIDFSGYSPEIIVDVFPNCDGGSNTSWEFKVSCPQ